MFDDPFHNLEIVNGLLQLKHCASEWALPAALFSKASSWLSLGLMASQAIGTLELVQIDGPPMKLDFSGFKISLFQQQLVIQKANISSWSLMAMVVIWHQNPVIFAAKWYPPNLYACIFNTSFTITWYRLFYGVEAIIWSAIETRMRLGINHIDKLDFLEAYPHARINAFKS